MERARKMQLRPLLIPISANLAYNTLFGARAFIHQNIPLVHFSDCYDADVRQATVYSFQREQEIAIGHLP